MKNFLLGALLAYTVGLTAFTIGMCHGKIGVSGQAQVQYEQVDYVAHLSQGKK
jgi:hypothetical protein